LRDNLRWSGYLNKKSYHDRQKIWQGKTKKGRETMKTIKVKGMSCNHCVKAVTAALEAVDGVEDVKISLEKGEATFDEMKPVDMSVIKEKIRKAGFDVG
jgi:copper chaperone